MDMPPEVAGEVLKELPRLAKLVKDATGESLAVVSALVCGPQSSSERLSLQSFHSSLSPSLSTVLACSAAWSTRLGVILSKQAKWIDIQVSCRIKAPP